MKHLLGVFGQASAEMEQIFTVCPGFISVNIEVTFPFSGNGGMSPATDEKHCQESLKDCVCMMWEALAVEGFELHLMSSHMCTGFLIKSWLGQEINGHYCPGCILESPLVLGLSGAFCKCRKEQAPFGHLLAKQVVASG